MNDNATQEWALFGPENYSAPDSSRLGELLHEAGLISSGQAEDIARHSEAHKLRFGEAAVALGYVTQQDLDNALATQFDAAAPNRTEIDEQLICFSAPASQGAEDFRSLRNALALRWFMHPEGARTLAVVSAARGEGRSVVAANLAIAFAQVGFRTLLVDADMRAPSQHRLFNLDDRFGLAGYLAGRPEEAAFYDIACVPKLTVIPVGGTPPNPQELLLRGLLHKLLQRAQKEFEVIIIDTPAADTSTDYQLVAAEAVGALVVTSRDKTHVDQAKDLVKQCKAFGIRLVGSTMAIG